MSKSCDEKSNRKSKKERDLNKKRNKCSENDEKKKVFLKCPSTKHRPAKARKSLTKIEKIMLRIQPPIADRERYLHPEHVNCFLEKSERVYIKKSKCVPCPLERPKVCTEDKKKQKNHENGEGKENEDNVKAKDEVKTVKDKDEKTGDGKERDAEFEARMKESEEKHKVEGDKKTLERSKVKGQVKNNKKKTKKQTRRHKTDIQEDSNSEMSICSNDSEVCLAGLRLTEEDKKQIEENRRKIHPPPDNEDKNTPSIEDNWEISTPEIESVK